MTFAFRPIDLNDPYMVAGAILFRRDAFVATSGDDIGWLKANGYDGRAYIDRARQHADGVNPLWVQMFDADRPVGQIEAQAKQKGDDVFGYINLFYLVPDYRGIGHGAALQDYITDQFKARGVKQMQLTSRKDNVPAMAFYRKHGWMQGAEREDQPGFFFMHKTLEAT